MEKNNNFRLSNNKKINKNSKRVLDRSNIFFVSGYSQF